VLLLEIDRFQLINDTLGHEAGDNLLRFLARKMKAHLPTGHTFARFGEDAFIVMLPGVSGTAEIETVCKRLLALIGEPFPYNGRDLHVTASVGVSVYPNDGADADTVIRNADTAMYYAKEKGGNTYRFYRPNMSIWLRERLDLETGLRKALEYGELAVHYQPIVNLSDGRISGAEALMRWRHAEFGDISPNEFIPLAEETGLIHSLGNWILREVCRQIRNWIRRGFPPLQVTVNISANQLLQPDFVRLVRDTLEEARLDPRLLYLEITENVTMKNVADVIETINELRRLGVNILIDDFGTGYSWLNYLKKFKVHTIKIDRSFIQGLSTDKENAAIVTALIGMARRMNIKSLAEGVETNDQLRFLMENGCDQIQGFLISEPLPPDDFEKFFRNHKGLMAGTAPK